MAEETKREKEELSDEAKTVLLQQGMLLAQLIQSDKFVQFINMNYDIMRDDETKTMYVVEVPDEVAAERAMDIMKDQAQAAPRIQVASEADLKNLTKK